MEHELFHIIEFNGFQYELRFIKKYYEGALYFGERQITKLIRVACDDDEEVQKSIIIDACMNILKEDRCDGWINGIAPYSTPQEDEGGPALSMEELLEGLISCMPQDGEDYDEDEGEEIMQTATTRHYKAREDSSIETLQKEIEATFGLPSGSVRLINPGGRKIKSNAKVGRLRKNWEN